MKRYYNESENRWHYEGQSITHPVEGGIFSGIPSEEQLQEWGYTLREDPEPTPPTEEELAEMERRSLKEEYDYKVAAMVRERYSESEEFAIQRKFLNSISGQHSQPAEEEFNQYNAFVEECKVRAKEDLTANESALLEEYRQLENAGDDADLCLSPGESI